MFKPCKCGNRSLAEVVDHICSGCEDLYVFCPGCLSRDALKTAEPRSIVFAPSALVEHVVEEEE